MFRKKNIYRRLWYMRKRNSKGMHRISVILSILIIFMIIATYAYNRIFPVLMEISERKTQAMVTICVNEAVNSRFDKNLSYQELVLIDRDSLGHVTSIHTDVVKINILSSGLSIDIQKRLSELSKEEVTVPAVAFLKNPFVLAGPEIHVKMIPVGNVETDIKSEFTSAGINQTRHRIFLEVKSYVKVSIPFDGKEYEMINHIPLAETIIVGEAPQIYTQ